MEPKITSRAYTEHNCSRPHRSVEAQLKCFFKEGFSNKKRTLGKKQPSVCLFRGEGQWAVVHSRDLLRSKHRDKPHTEYVIDLFEDFDDAIDYWTEVKTKCNGIDKCRTHCSGLYPHIMAVVLGWPYKTFGQVKNRFVWPSGFVKNLFIYPREESAKK